MRLVEWNKPAANGQVSRAVYQHPFSGVLENVFGNDLFQKEHASFVPAVNIAESESAYQLELSAPGFNKTDFKIALEKRTLVVSGKHAEEKEVKEQKFSRKEFNYGAFQRVFKLPENANESAIAATYENGILKLEIPKKEQEKNESREISIS
ncbi:MAG: Hsp20/alpha crystallin family protein [Cytophagaceae bacterium]|jgi:HSP20 family protein|nr:Hsp20/alpha crystallin family protein [Cytophagaceae bacterium]